MRGRICILVLIGCLAPFGVRASDASDQTPDLSDQGSPPSTTAAGELEQAPPLPANRPIDLRNQPNQLSGRIGAGVIETDNIERTPSDRISDTIGELTADVVAHEQTRRLDVDVLSDLQYLTFAHNYFSNELVGNFIGSGTIAILPQQFEWVVQENFGQQQLDPTVAVTPANLENVNYFTTGPNFVIGLTSQVRTQVSLRYSDVYYQKSDLDNNRGDASVGLIRSQSPNSNISLNVEAERVDFQDSSANPDYTTEEAYGRYELQGARTNLMMDLGYDEIRGLSSSGAGVLVHFDATRVLSPSALLELSLGQDISDTSSLLRQLQNLNGLAVNAAYLQRANDPFINRYARLGWQFNRNRTFVDFDVARYEEHHLEDFGLDQGRTQTDLTVRRDLSPALMASIGGTYAKASYSASAASYRDVIAFAALEWRIGRRLNLRAEYDRFDQHGNVLTNVYLENRIGVTLGWQVDNVRAPDASPRSRGFVTNP